MITFMPPTIRALRIGKLNKKVTMILSKYS